MFNLLELIFGNPKRRRSIRSTTPRKRTKRAQAHWDKAAKANRAQDAANARSRRELKERHDFLDSLWKPKRR
jgi:hypothetical protein